MVEVIESFGKMEDRHAVVFKSFGKLKINFYEDFNFCGETTVKTKSKYYAFSLAENWSGYIFEKNKIPTEI
tara:strand:+ start:855 stop:1067 length:213 start_codon:yes stop_codon:yes gene_type:complete